MRRGRTGNSHPAGRAGLLGRRLEFDFLAHPLEDHVEHRYKEMPTRAAASMPPNTAAPTPRRLSLPAPLAKMRGTRPAMKAKLVIITARKRSLAPSAAASEMSNPCRRRSMANSTIRMPDFQHLALDDGECHIDRV